MTLIVAKEIALKYIKNHAGHDISHIMRVEKLADKIRQGILIDPVILFNSVWLHDVGREEEFKTGEDHAIISSRIAKEELNKIVYFPKDKIPKILYCIESHSYRSGIKPKTIDAMILQDANRLDCMGAIGLIRTFSHDTTRKFYHENDPFYKTKRELDDKIYTLDHFYQKLANLADTLNTKIAKDMAKQRIKYMGSFVKQLELELKGKI